MDQLRHHQEPLLEIYGRLTFNLKEIEKRVSKEVFEAYRNIINTKGTLPMSIAPDIAQAMKEWALENGATHYCHWFQPMTGSTAEKHDAFIDYKKEGGILEKFGANQLIQGEPDASSFPSGGIRSTFEARGYTAWDAGNFAFLRIVDETVTLCIPSVFISYHGEALDEKTPLLRSMRALNDASLRLLRALGNDKATRVTTYVGSEQEYFLIDKDLFDQRLDLVMTQRTLIGSLPAKTQQLEDHYFGAIPERVINYMNACERELYALGIPIKTRHNEVAPRQFEIAPLYEEAHLATDHNLLVMEVMKRFAPMYGFALLLHEKPFAGINGSGKHNNWSIAADHGGNLLEPGDTPQANIQFLVFLVAILKGLHKRSDIIRASIANAGNDHRLGANEAPPAIISAFLGHELSKILDEIERGEVSQSVVREKIELGIAQLPHVQKDNTDRNRTSPFAFTGNKFEFRAVSSSAHIALPNMVLNTVMCEAIDELTVLIEKEYHKNSDKGAAIFEVLRREIKATKAVRFEGDGYSEEWQKEAKKRGLPNIKNTPQALKTWKKSDVCDIFTKYKVLSQTEISSRLNVRFEQYKKAIDIEAKTLANMIRTQILPACLDYQTDLAITIEKISDKKAGLKNSDIAPIKSLLATISKLVAQMLFRVDELEKTIHGIEAQKGVEAEADYCANKVIPAINAIRDVSDAVENYIPKNMWPIPSYFEMLFSI